VGGTVELPEVPVLGMVVSDALDGPAPLGLPDEHAAAAAATAPAMKARRGRGVGSGSKGLLLVSDLSEQ
jgi:hypothetical protein